MISIILNCYSPLKSQRHMDMACVAAIRKFTDGDYEIIIVDNEPVHRFRDDYNVLEPFTLITNEKNHNVYESYNQGAKVAKGGILMFIQNDVFVHERTINKLAAYLDHYDVAFPQQIEMSREDTKKIQALNDGEFADKGWRDAGLLAIRKVAFAKTGGWDERFHNLLGEAAFYQRMERAGLRWTCNTNAIVTHIMAGNNLSKPTGLYNRQMDHDSKLLKREYQIEKHY